MRVHENWSVDYPEDTKHAVAEAVEAWRAFSDLPMDTKMVGKAVQGSAAGCGFESTEVRTDTKDAKENFDVKGGDAIAGLRSVYADVPIAGHFLDKAAILLDNCLPDLAKNFLHQLDESGARLKRSDTDGLTYFMRFLHYFPSSDGSEIAQPHLDNGGFTFHLYESTDGCERLTTTGQWEPLPIEPGTATVIPGYQLQYASSGQVEGLCHRVVAGEETARLGRYAAVCFVHLGGVASYNKSQFGRLQEYTPGFNYGEPKAATAARFT